MNLPRLDAWTVHNARTILLSGYVFLCKQYINDCHLYIASGALLFYNQIARGLSMIECYRLIILHIVGINQEILAG